MRALRGRLSGICQPTYVLDIPGGHGKLPIGPSYLSKDGTGCQVEDFNGRLHRYPPNEGPPEISIVAPSAGADTTDRFWQWDRSDPSQTALARAERPRLWLQPIPGRPRRASATDLSQLHRARKR